MRLIPVTLLLAACVVFGPPAHAQREKFTVDELEFIDKTWPKALKTSTGIRYVIVREGSGQPAKPGDTVHVLYEGTLLDGTPFDKVVDKDHPFSFRVGRQKVISGWDQILVLVKPGEKRTVVIPAELAYGSRGEAPKIPRDAALVFTIELLSIDRE
jgi:FKBP-type peptidyl-prolyl cis-trans isomerase